jgi:NAD(P)-dependent dehydrogenase (short-subunit alcohol dehydrogenase family)
MTILVNNAGIYPSQLLAEMSAQDWDRIQNINLRGAFLCSREAVRGQQARSPGRIVNISSISAVHPPCWDTPDTRRPKAGLVMLTKTLALEVASDGILVNAVLPGGVMTDRRPTGGLGRPAAQQAGSCSALLIPQSTRQPCSSSPAQERAT